VRLLPAVPSGDLASKVLGEAAFAGIGLKVLARAGVIRPYGPRTLASLGTTLLRWGTGPAGGFTSVAIRDPDRVGIIDELGPLTYGELHARSNALAHALRDRGVGEGDAVAVMCRNHRGFLDATVAVAKLGADILYLNTAFAGPQLIEVLHRERPRMVILDEEFAEPLSGADLDHRILAWTDTAAAEGVDTVESLIAAYPGDDLSPPDHRSRIVILTSGTTGTPKGAPRSEAGLEAAVAMLERIPLRFGRRTHVAAPLFHTWGFAHLGLSMLLGSTVVLRRRFDPEQALGVLQDESCESFAVIPVMLQRILSLPDPVLASYDLSGLRVVAASGSSLPGDLAVTWMDRFGDNLYNVYGSTEVAYASIATPADLRAAPTSAGHPPWGTVVRILDDDGRAVVPTHPGRIFVGNSMLFEGYTGGGNKEMVDGLMSTGDVGRFGADGRLYVEGRDDEMIVSGGENVFPSEVEHCLARHPAVVEATAVGVPDEEFGQRLRAFVSVTDPTVTEEELKDYVGSQLARFKVPREIVFLDELPRNATGKILKRHLHGEQ
jgi:acyl-CoA synthetase (AMP-forming)/AMP-acid ligase II